MKNDASLAIAIKLKKDFENLVKENKKLIKIATQQSEKINELENILHTTNALLKSIFSVEPEMKIKCLKKLKEMPIKNRNAISVLNDFTI